MSDEKVYVLDSSGIIGGFIHEKLANFTTSQIIMEIKDLKSKIILQRALEEGLITIKEPAPEDMGRVEEVINKSGDLLRLSEADKKIIALAVSLQKNKTRPVVVTDDYSIQNVLRIMEISYKSVLTPGITETVVWVKFCKGCKRKYPSNYTPDECEICGSPISRKRIEKNLISKKIE